MNMHMYTYCLHTLYSHISYMLACLHVRGYEIRHLLIKALAQDATRPQKGLINCRTEEFASASRSLLRDPTYNLCITSTDFLIAAGGFRAEVIEPNITPMTTWMQCMVGRRIPTASSSTCLRHAPSNHDSNPFVI